MKRISNFAIIIVFSTLLLNCENKEEEQKDLQPAGTPECELSLKEEIELISWGDVITLIGTAMAAAFCWKT